MNDMGVDHFEWLRGEFRKDPSLAIGYLKVATEEEPVILLDALKNVADAYREQHPDIARKADNLRERLNDMRWPTLAVGYPLPETAKNRRISKEPASTSVRRSRRRMDQARTPATETGG
ncbi:MAG: hypothetical protein F4Y00_06170 [Bacteroidetes bacterium SB0662_bin_6]|nr:hypothetical protein [Bacteroidetes bacterium SB0668_bin_1]MYE04539.1 hypothetical protein [Bacteroidetes bacterium SB0662_bin_6]